jgi:diguanylate cyclase (GGDEF)-like protein
MAKHKIIIIEENNDSLLSLKKALKNSGFALTVFNNCFEALSEMKAEGADVIVCQANLKEMTGFQLTTLLKTNFSWRSRLIPVVLITDDDKIDNFSSRRSQANLVVAQKKNNEKTIGQIKVLIEKSRKDGYTRELIKEFPPTSAKFSSTSTVKNYNNLVNNLLSERLISSFVNDLLEANNIHIQLIPKFFDFLNNYLSCDLAGLVSSQPAGYSLAAFKANTPINENSFDELVGKITKTCNLPSKPQAEILVSSFSGNKGSSLKSSKIIPLKSKNNDVIGAMVIGWFEKYNLDTHAKEFIEKLEHNILPVLKVFSLLHEISIYRERERYTSSTDPQTGLYNIEFLVGFLQQQLLFSHRQKLPVTLLMADVDHFSRVKQDFGVEMADIVLTAVANRLLQSVRGSDLIARYGEDLFAIVLPNTDLAGAKTLAEKLRMEIGQLTFTNERNTQLPQITVSIGASKFIQNDLNPETIIRDAKLALKRAKDKGRNCVSE